MLSSVNIIWSEERNLHISSSVYKPKQSKTICGWILMWETTGDWLFHWRKHYYGLWTLILVKNVLMDLFFTSTQLLSSPDVNWWTGVVWITCGLLWCFYQLFGLSFWRHPFTAEHPLLRRDAVTHFYKSDEETNSSTSWMVWGWEHFQ